MQSVKGQGVTGGGGRVLCRVRVSCKGVCGVGEVYKQGLARKGLVGGGGGDYKFCQFFFLKKI